MPHVWVTGYVMVHKQLTDPRTNVQNFVSHPTHIICIWYFVNFRHNKNVVILSKYCHFAFSSCNNLGVYWSGCTTFLIFHICDHPNILSVHDYPVVALESQKTGINLPIPQLCWSSCWVSLLHLLSGGLSVFDQFLSRFWLLCKPRAVVASTFSFRKFSSFEFFHIQLFINWLSNKDAASSLLFHLFTYQSTSSGKWKFVQFQLASCSSRFFLPLQILLRN